MSRERFMNAVEILKRGHGSNYQFNEEYLCFILNYEQFRFIQGRLSPESLDAKFGESLESSTHVIQREETVSPFRGWYAEKLPLSCGGVLRMFLKTRNGILCHSFYEDGGNGWEMRLPASAIQDSSLEWLALNQALEGLTLEQWDKWKDQERRWKECTLDHNPELYDEWVKWHNSHMVSLGFPPKPTIEEIDLEDEINWALALIKFSVLPKAEAITKTPGNPIRRLELSNQIIGDLERAAQNMRDLTSGWITEI